MSISTTDPVALAPGSLEHVRGVLDRLGAGEWWRAGEADLVEVLGAVGRIRQELVRVEVHATAEVLKRGMPKEQIGRASCRERVEMDAAACAVGGCGAAG